jgi:signal transduction histidine kinase
VRELSKYVLERGPKSGNCEWSLNFASDERRAKLALDGFIGVPLARLSERPLERTWVQGVAAGFTVALGRLRERGLISEDIELVRLLLDSTTGADQDLMKRSVESAQWARGMQPPVFEIVLKLLGKKGEERSQTAANLKADLRRWLAGAYPGKDRGSDRCGLGRVHRGNLAQSRFNFDPVRTLAAPAEKLDGLTVAKALQLISGEIIFENLVDTLLTISLEHSGADRAILILPRSGELSTEAEAMRNGDDIEVRRRELIGNSFDFPKSIIRSVALTREGVLLDDAELENLFSADDYIRSKRLRSVLCLPLLNQETLIGLLYLEHSLAPRVFTTNRLAMLELVASQGAISIKNARLFAGLTQENLNRARSEEDLEVGSEEDSIAHWRSAELAKANEALRACLDALADVSKLDEFLGQITAAIAGQLGAVSSTLRLWDFEKGVWKLEFVFQNGRVMSPDEAEYPEAWRSLSLDETHFADPAFDQPLSLLRITDANENVPEDRRSYLLGLGIKTVLVIPLVSAGQALGRLTFRFNEERDAHPEEFEIARALATQASLAIHLTRLAEAARQSAVLEERYRLAGEIHDSLAQNFSGISMQLFAAEEVIKNNRDDGLRYVERANDLARFGLAEARRSTLTLQSTVIAESGLVEALQMLVERSNIPDKIRCTFYSNGLGDESLPHGVQQDLLRIAQEALSNAMRHAKPTVVRISLRSSASSIVLEIRDNGCGMASDKLETDDGFGFGNMRARAKKLNADIAIRAAKGRGTSVVVRLPINQ